MKKIKAGFTLIELVVVIAVIAILMTISVVSYNGLRNRGIATSLKADLNAASKSMGHGFVGSTNSQFPTTLPSDVVPTKGNVLQLTAVADNKKSYCINAYGPNNQVASIDSDGTIRDYLCSGATVGTAVGGTVPTTPRNTNLIADFSLWKTSGGMTYNDSTKEMVCTNGVIGNATSPLMRVDKPTSGSFKYDAYATVASPTRPTSGTYVASKYYATDGTTPAYNTTASPGPYTGNGIAPALSTLSSWQSFTFTMNMGPDIIYGTIIVHCDLSANRYTSDTRYRNPVFTVQ